MELIENTFEKARILQLSPNARDLAELLFSTHSLCQLLDHYLHNQLDAQLLSEYHLLPSQVPTLLSALLLAKATYFIPNPRFQPEEVNYLIRLACHHAGYPLEHYSLTEILIATEEAMPTLHQWLIDMKALQHA